MFVVGSNVIGFDPEFEPVEAPNAAAALVTLAEQLRHDAPEHPLAQLRAADIEHGYHVTVGDTEYWIKTR